MAFIGIHHRLHGLYRDAAFETAEFPRGHRQYVIANASSARL